MGGFGNEYFVSYYNMKQSRRCRVRKHKRTLKRRNKKKMMGGLFTVNGTEYMNHDAWTAVLEMMRCPGATLSVISYDSLYGFILLLTIPENNPSYVKFIDENRKPVYKIVFKIVLLGDPKKVRLPEFNEEYKSVMTENSFVNESNNQKTFFSKTNMNKKPITLGVACHEVFHKNKFSIDVTDAKYSNFITHLNQFKTNGNPNDLDNIINYIDGCMRTSVQLTDSGHVINESEIIHGIGIIVMNFAGNYISDTENFNMTTLTDAIHTYDNISQTNTNNIIQQNSQYAINKCYEYAIANLLILLLEFKVVPTDAHTSNFMAMFFKNISKVPIELNNLDGYLDVKMIDMAYLLNIFDISDEYKATFNGTINHIFPPVYSWGQQIMTDYYTSYIQELLSNNVETLSIMTSEKIITMLHHFVIVIALIDSIKKSIVKKRQSDIIPQCSFMLYYLVGSPKMNDLILTNPMDENIQHKYLNIFERMKSIILTTKMDSVVKDNGNERSVIKSSTTSGKIGRKHAVTLSKRDNTVNKYRGPFSVNL